MNPERQQTAGATQPPTLSVDSQLMQDYLQSTGILVSPLASPSVAAFQNNDGDSEAVVIDVNGNLQHVCREPLSDSGWNMYGLGAGFRWIAPVDAATLWALGLTDVNFWQNNQGRWTQFQLPLPNGRAALELSVGIDGTVWALDDQGNVYAMASSPTQTAPRVGANAAPVAVQGCSGLLSLFCLDQNGALWTISQNVSAGGWGSWTPLGTPAGVSLATLAAGPNQDGRLQVFAIDSGNSLHTVYETAPGVWSAWNVLAPPAASPSITNLAVDQNLDGRLEVFAIGTDKVIHHIAQTAPNNGWSSWASFGTPSGFGISPTTVAVGQETDGRLTVFTAGTGLPSLSAVQQTTPGNGWSAWMSIANSEILAPMVDALVVGRNQDGRLQVFVIYPSGPFGAGVWYSDEQSPNETWNEWETLGAPSGGVSLVTLTVERNEDGRLELFSLDSSGTVWHNWQTSPGSHQWNGWASLGTPSGVQIQRLTLLRDRSGRLAALGLDSTGALWQIQQTAPNADWGPWLSTWSAWSPVNAPALKHAPTGTGSACWAVGGNGALVNWNGTQWSTVTLPQSQPAAWISVGSDGSVWALDTSGVLYQYANGSFQAMPSSLPGIAYFSADGAGSLWATAATHPATPKDYALFHYTDRTWQPVPTPPLYGAWNPPQVFIAADGSLCLLDGSGTAWRQATGTWIAKKISGNFQSIAGDVATAGTGAAWAVDAGGTFWRNFGNRWVDGQPSLPGGATATRVSVGNDGTLWALDNTGSLYVKSGQAWSQVSGAPSLQQTPSGSAGTYWTIDRAGDLLYWDGSGGWITVQLPAGSAKADSVSVGTDGSVWVLVSTNTGAPAAYQYVNGTWQQAGGNFAQAPSGSVNDLWCVTLAGGVCRSSDGGQTWSTDNAAPADINHLTVCPDGAVWVLDTSGTAWINPAWQRIMRPTGMPGWQGTSQCVSVAAGCDENGFRYVFFTNQQGALNYTFEVLPHTWIDPEQLAGQGVSHLGITNQQDTGEVIAYGISGTALVAARKGQPSNPYFSMTTYVPPVIIQLPWLDVELCAVDAGHWYWFALEPLSQNLDLAVSSADNNAPNFYWIGNEASKQLMAFSRIVRLPWPRPAQAPYTAAIDKNGNIQLISLSSLTSQDGYYWEDFLALTGAGTLLPSGATAVAALLQSDSASPPQPRLYATAPITSGGTTTDALWVLRQIDLSVPISQPAAWSSWIPLGGSYNVLAIGPSLKDSENLFAVSSRDGSLHSVSQNSVTGKWTDLEINRPSLAGDEIDAVAMYHSQIALSDQNGVPQGNVPLTITAETPVTVWIENAMYRIDADQGVTCITNATGSLLIRTLATDLHTPTLMVQGGGLTGTQSVYLPQHVHNFLAGTGQLAVGGGLPTTFTAPTIRSQWPNVTQDNANHAVTYAKQIAAMPNGASSKPTAAGWAVDFAGSDHPTFHVFPTTEALAAYRHGLDQRRGHLGLPGSIWDHIKHAAEDVVHAIKKGAMKVDSIVVDSANKVVTLTLYIGDQLIGIFDLAVETVEDVIHAIEVVLKALIADIEEIIEWLMLLFKWEDIWTTKEKLEGFLLQAVSTMQAQIGAVRTAAQGLFTSVKDTLNADFAALIGALQSGSFPYTTFADLPQWPSTGASAASIRRRASDESATLPSPGSIAHSNWLLLKTLRHITPSLDVGPPASINLQELISAMNAQNLVADIQQAITDFENYLMQLFTNPGKFAELTIAAVLQELKDLLFALLDLLDDLAQVFLDLVDQMLGIMNGWFNRHLDIPVISQLYKFITGLLGTSESLTVLHLFALLTAVPLTIVHKLVFNGQKPYDGLDVVAYRLAAGRAPSITPATEAILWNQAYLIVGWLYTASAATRDALGIAQKPGMPPNPAMQFFRGLTDVAAWWQRINSWPGMFPNLPHPDTAAAKWLLANWCVYWIPPMVDAAFIPVDVPEARIPCLFVLGIAALVTFYVAANKESLNDYLVAQNVIQPWPLLLSLLMLPSVRTSVIDATDGLGDPAILKLVADGLINLGFSTLRYVGNS